MSFTRRSLLLATFSHFGRHLERTLVRGASDVRVRVRFAPSPTGHLHLGGLRTALYNYLYARSHGGKFMLRIEDTDQSRLVPGATEALIEDLQWAGIDIDEGPGFGGRHGPYIQSERTKLYTDSIRILLDNGSAYRCFCTERRLELIRKEALRTRQVPRYDNKCRHLSAQQTASLLESGTPFCIRFKLSDYMEPVEDMIYGTIHHNVSETEGDPVILKSDEFPTYHFANVVDDHLMAVTHVFRGVEWQISTTKHLLLYKAFKWQPPKFGHLPLLVNADGTKLSKRQGDISIRSFREKGYFPEALVNYVASAGGGFMHERYAKPQIMTLADLVQQFDLERVNSHPSRLNPELLDQFNRLELMRQLQGNSTAAAMVRNVQSLVASTYPEQSNLDLDESHVRNVLDWAGNRINFISDLVSPQLSFLWVKPNEFALNGMSLEQLQQLEQAIQSAEFSKEHLKRLLRQFAQEQNVKYALLMKVLRGILSGLKEGPGVAEMMEILGKQVVLQRLRSCLSLSLNNHHVPAQSDCKIA